MEHTDFLLDLLNTPSPTAYELEGQRKWMAFMRGQTAATVDHDAYGNAWAVLEGKRGPGRKIMIEAHADEIGFIIKQITKEGYLRIDRIGGSDVATARGRRITILGDTGPVRGIIGNTAIHLRKDSLSDEKAPKVHELYVDVGASSAEEVLKMGLRVGHPAVYVESGELVGDRRIMGRALDNKLGSFILTQVISRLSDSPESFHGTVVAVNAVQEEIGGNGARMVTHRLRPDIAIVLDVTHATDTPDILHAQHGEVRLGAGPTLTHGTSNHPMVVRRLMDVADAENLPIQHESSSRYSGTDTDVIFTVGDGIPSALVSLPLRYMHSVVELADLDDVDKVVSLVTGFVRSVQSNDDFRVQL